MMNENIKLKAVGIKWDEEKQDFVDNPDAVVITEGHHPEAIVEHWYRDLLKRWGGNHEQI